MNLIRERLLQNAGLASETELERWKTSFVRTNEVLEEWKSAIATGGAFERAKEGPLPTWLSSFGARTRALFHHYAAGA